jgi:hypothetical protein
LALDGAIGRDIGFAFIRFFSSSRISSRNCKEGQGEAQKAAFH